MFGIVYQRKDMISPSTIQRVALRYFMLELVVYDIRENELFRFQSEYSRKYVLL